MKNPFTASLAVLVHFATGLLAAEDPESWKWNDPKELNIPGLRHGVIESVLLKYPDMLGATASLAAGIEKDAAANGGDNSYQDASALSKERKDLLRLFMVVGEDDFLFKVHPTFAQHLKESGIADTLVTHSKVGHDLGKLTGLSGAEMIRHLARQISPQFRSAAAATRPEAGAAKPTETVPAGYDGWPFDAAEAVRRQTETSQKLNLPVVLQTPLAGKDGPALPWRLIPSGKFMMGSPQTENGHEGDERLHAETIAEAFYMLETQLTVEQYRALMQSEPSDAGEGGDPKMPAGILYRDTVDKVLPALAKLAPAGWKVILPDQARLEYAARAGVATMNPGGDQPEDAAPFAWSRENSGGKVHAVGQKRANAWGLHDVIGNRWHWFWRAGAGYGDASTEDHIVYGGHARSESGGNGARLANIMISKRPEGARFALIRADAAVPKGHPETRQQPK